MATSTSAVNEVLALLAELRAQEEAIMKEVEDRLVYVRNRIAATETVLEMLTGNSGQDEARSLPTTTNGWAQKLKGLTQVQALVRMAQENEGVVRVRDARRIFMATGLAKGKPKYVGPHLYHILKDAEQFERVAPGTFKLVQEPKADGSEVASLLPV
jgi:hypothetical protein